MSEYLFTYGTLRPGLAPREMAALVARLQPVGEGWLHGTLYDFGHYPGALIDPACEGKIYGLVSRLPDDPEFLQRLDSYEEFDPQSPETSQFLRELHPVMIMDGSKQHCWVYVFNWPIGAARIVESGRYAGQKTRREFTHLQSESLDFE